MSLFDYEDYKSWVNDWIAMQPSGGHGQLRQLALRLGINSVVMSQVFRGPRDLTLEQALGVAKFIGLTELERDYFLLLVQKARAGSHDLKKVFESQIVVLRKSSKSLKNRIQHQELRNEDRATFYSQWYYSAVRLSTSMPELGSVSAIANYLHLERSLVAKVVEFLLKHQLIIQNEGRLDIGPQITHVGHDSPFVNRHHTNWRLKGLQALEKLDEVDLFYTGPMALSNEAAESIRKSIIALIEKSTTIASTSTSEEIRCLNIDWFGI